MYDPKVVDTFIRVYRDIEVTKRDAPEHRKVMQRIAQSHHDRRSIRRRPTTAASTRACLPSSASRASRRARAASPTSSRSARGCSATSCRTATGAWYVPDAARDRLVVAEAFGPAAQALRGYEHGDW